MKYIRESRKSIHDRLRNLYVIILRRGTNSRTGYLRFVVCNQVLAKMLNSEEMSICSKISFRYAFRSNRFQNLEHLDQEGFSFKIKTGTFQQLVIFKSYQPFRKRVKRSFFGRWLSWLKMHHLVDLRARMRNRAKFTAKEWWSAIYVIS